MGPPGTAQHATNVGAWIMTGCSAWALGSGRWAATGVLGGLAIVGFVWARWLGRHPD
jgi:hypothetical protein